MVQVNSKGKLTPPKQAPRNKIKKKKRIHGSYFKPKQQSYKELDEAANWQTPKKVKK